MKKEQDYKSDLAIIRSMMERSAKFMSLSGWAGILAGIYAITGVLIAWKLSGLDTGDLAANNPADIISFNVTQVILIFGLVLILALATAIIDSSRKARARNENAWNPVSRRLLRDMSVPLFTGGIAVVLFIIKGLLLLVAPFTLIFYGLALFVAGRYTYSEVKFLGYVEIILGMAALWLVELSLVLWITGFGIAHIVYGIVMHYRYKK